MAIDYMEVLGIIGGLTARHPQSTSLIMQTYSLWNTNAAEINQVQAEYQRAAPQGSGPMDTAGIVLQIAAMHPKAAALLIQTLTMWQTRIPDLIQILQELQAAATEASKS